MDKLNTTEEQLEYLYGCIPYKYDTAISGQILRKRYETQYPDANNFPSLIGILIKHNMVNWYLDNCTFTKKIAQVIER
jgi:hypothetical protein